MGASSWVHLDVDKILRATEKALLLRLDDGEEVWCPLSQIDDADAHDVGDTDCTVSVSQWWADKEGLN